MSLIPRVIVRRWLESVLALVSIAMLYLNQHPEALPRALDLKNDANLTLWDWIFRGMVFGLLGVWGFSGVVVIFFLLYSPISTSREASLGSSVSPRGAASTSA